MCCNEKDNTVSTRKPFLTGSVPALAFRSTHTHPSSAGSTTNRSHPLVHIRFARCTTRICGKSAGRGSGQKVAAAATEQSAALRCCGGLRGTRAGRSPLREPPTPHGRGFLGYARDQFPVAESP